MNVLLLGAGGFIGSHTVEALIEQGRHRIVGADLAGDKLKGIEDPAFTFHQVDLVSDGEITDELIAGADTVVDLISYANPSIYVSKPLDVFNLNFQANLRVLERCAETGTRLIQYSTAEIYGRPSGPAYVEDESDLAMGPVNKQRWIYAASKQLRMVGLGSMSSSQWSRTLS